MESSLDKIEEDHEMRDRIRIGKTIVKSTTGNKNSQSTSKAQDHRLWPEVSLIISSKIIFISIVKRSIIQLDLLNVHDLYSNHI